MSKFIGTTGAVLLILTAATAGIAAETSPPPIPAWGASRAEILGSLPSPALPCDGDLIQCRTRFAGLACRLVYRFDADRLVEAGLEFEEIHTDPNKHIRDMERVRQALCAAIAPPVADRWRYLKSEDLYRALPTRTGLGVVAGEVTYEAHWRTDDASVELRLDGDFFKVRHHVAIRPRS